MNSKILESLDESKKIYNYLVELIVNKPINSDLEIGYFDILTEHITSIYLLIEKKYYGSAMALMRPSYETFVRGYYTTLLNQVDKEKIRNDSYKFPNTT